MALDAPLLGLSRQLPDAVAARLLVVPRSSATLTQPAHDPGRPRWELAGLRDAASLSGRIGAISSFMRLT